MKKRYFHEIAEAEWEALKAGGLTWGQVRERYVGPPWCAEQGVVVDAFGCWSLIDIGEPYRITKEDDCKKCDLYRRKK